MNQDNQVRLTKKRLILLSFAVFLFILLIYAFNHSLLIISAGAEKPETVYIQKYGDSEPREIEIDGGKKFLLLSKGTYTTSAISGDKETAIYSELSGFSIKNITIGFQAIKKTLFLGSSDKECALNDTQNNKTTFYPCNLDTNSDIESTSDGVINSTVVETYEVLENFTIYNDQYDKGLLRFEGDGKLLTIYSVDFSGVKTELVKINNFGGPLNKNTVHTNDGGDLRISLYDSSARQLYVVQPSASNKVKKVDVTKYVIADDNHAQKVLVAGKFLYLVNQTYTESAYGDDEVSDKVDLKQNVVVFSLDSVSAQKTIEIQKNLAIDKIELSDSGTLLFNDGSDAVGVFYTLNQDGKLNKLISTEKTQNFCWKDASNFYYSTGSGDRVYLYDTASSTAYLIYKNTSANIANMVCKKTATYLSYINEIDPDNSVQHLLLTDGEQKGRRPESVFPFYIELKDGLAEAILYRNTISVKLLYNDNPSKQYGVVEKQELINNARTKLGEEGIDTSAFNFVFK